MSKTVMRTIAVSLFAAICIGSVFAAAAVEEPAALPKGSLLPWTGEEVIFQGFGADLGITEDPTMPVVQEYRKTTGNVRIDWSVVPWNDFDTKVNLYLQSGDLPDILWARDPVAKSHLYGPLGFFLDWETYRDYMPNLQKAIEDFPYLNNLLTQKGERFTLTDYGQTDRHAYGWAYNPAILEQAGISAPPDTVEELLQQMKRVKAVLPETDGYLSYWGINYIIAAFSRAMGVKATEGGNPGIDYDTDLEKWIYGPTMDPDYKNLIAYLNEAYEAGVFNLDALSSDIRNEKTAELIGRGNHAFQYMSHWAYTQASVGGGPDTPMRWMKTPSYQGKTYYWMAFSHDSVSSFGFLANAKVKNPELLASYVDNIISYEISELFEWGLEGVTFKRLPGGGHEFLPEIQADMTKATDLGVSNFWDPRFVHYVPLKELWFTKEFPNKDDPGRHALCNDLKMLYGGVYTPVYRPYRNARPVMSVEQNDEIGKIMAPLTTFVQEQQLKFITGAREMSEWDGFIAQVNQRHDIDTVLRYYGEGVQIPIEGGRWADLDPHCQ